MARNDIRLRRQAMTSRRIERHKNYDELMKRHRRTSRAKLVFKLVAGGLIVLLLIFLFVFFSN